MTAAAKALALVNAIAPRKAEQGDERLTDLGMDKLDLISIGIEIEMEHECALSDAEVFGWVYISDIAKTIERVGRVRV